MSWGFMVRFKESFWFGRGLCRERVFGGGGNSRKVS
jgi:hypothetical protein